MKRAVFLLFVILSFYIAGLYRYPPLLVLSTAALLSFPLLFALPRYLKKRLFVEPVRKSETAQKEQELVCGLRVRNTGKLPVRPVWTVRQRPVWSRAGCAATEIQDASVWRM